MNDENKLNLKLIRYPDSPNFTRDASDGGGDFKSRVEFGGNCWFAGLILGWRHMG
jgi:hypothetical protein